MFSELLREQEFAVRLLRSHFKTGRLSHAYLLTGVGAGSPRPQTQGEETSPLQLTLGFACALNCERGKIFEACDCNPCRKIQNRLHPDVHWIGEDLKTKSIKIEETRNIIQGAGFKTFEGKKKVFILLGPERLTLEAANAFLKILEEPPADTHFILAVENKSRLLDTIQSRCFEIRLKPAVKEEGEGVWPDGPEAKSWEDWLEPYQNVERPKVKEDLARLVEWAGERLRRFSGENPAEIPKWIEAMEKILETQEALEANANQKLALTRLLMQLEKSVGNP